MSCYLERMAAGVLSRERAIHPVVGSLWAPRQAADSVQASGEAPAIGEGAHRAQAAEADRSRTKAVVPARASALVPVIKEKTVSALQPLMPQAASQNDSFLAELRMAGTGEGETTPQQGASHSQKQRVFTPLIQPQSRETPQQSLSSLHLDAPAQPGTRVDAMRRQPQDKRSEREPDAIEIHIGRIEVLAAPQQQERRAPVPAPRKSLDLGEYLRRGGRAR